MSSPYQKAAFLLSAAEVKQLPPDTGFEVAIVGRSNAGKSSVLNRVTQSKSLARVSKTPGRTRLLNVFVLDDTHRLIDLPGYGFAKAPKSDKVQWEKAIDDYFSHRESLKGIVVVMDIRHPLRDSDVQLLDYCLHYNIAVHVLLNKADKISRGAAMNTLHQVTAYLNKEFEFASAQLFSALNKTGVEELQAKLDEWYGWGAEKV